jgi:hypothetical protein
LADSSADLPISIIARPPKLAARPGRSPGQRGPGAEAAEDEAMEEKTAPRRRRTRSTARWYDRFRTAAVAIELLLEAWKIVRDLL